MKIKQFIKGAALLTLTLAATSCEKNFLDINENPNVPTTSTPELVLPSALANTGALVNNNLNILGNLLSGNWAQAPDYLFYQPQETYQFTPTTYDAVWISFYSGGLNDYKYVETESLAAGKKNALAISKIMQAYNFQVLVDVWGDVPFKDALKGTSVIAPKFDKAEDIYDGILTLIDEGIASIDISATSDKPGSNDIVFAGDMTKWRKFANTLKLRILLRQSLIASRSAKVTAGFASLSTALFLGAGENAATNPGYLNQAGKFSPLYGGIGFNVNGGETNNFQATRANKYAVDFLNANSDPRLSLLYRLTKNGATYKGVIPGTTATPTAKSADYSAVGPAALPLFTDVPTSGTRLNNNGAYAGNVNGFAKSAYLLSAAESYFLQSEAYLKGYLSGGAAAAKTAFEKGIEESFKLDGSTAAAAQTYYSTSTQPLVNWTVASLVNRQFEAIITQKWVSNNGINGLEAWTELRRTGFPLGTPIPLNNVSGGKFPLRLPYPQSELAGNSANVPVIDIFNTKIFWEK
jgi:hypothetical protein